MLPKGHSFQPNGGAEDFGFSQTLGDVLYEKYRLGRTCIFNADHWANFGEIQAMVAKCEA
jgi:hypothetical protein